MSTGRSDQSDHPTDRGRINPLGEPPTQSLSDAPVPPAPPTRADHQIVDASVEQTTLNRPSNAQSDVAPLWLKRADQFLLATLLIALLALLIAFRLKLSGWGQSEIEILDQRPREFVYRLDINTASWVEWAQLDGIGEKLARRIVQDRTDRGPFQSIDDVGRVRGLGPKLIEKLIPYLKCPACETEQQSDQAH